MNKKILNFCQYYIYTQEILLKNVVAYAQNPSGLFGQHGMAL